MQRFQPLNGESMFECTSGEYVRADDVLAIVKGCWDYSGGHRSNAEHLEIYRHGMQTVLNAMTGALRADPNDTQSNAVLAMGQRANDTGILPNGEPVR